ncbi:hypothetical protein C789_1505 [Microcystis aeruginosa FACHB-905 = DIANCHI905]|nr:hypothetical protein C789_1505 [Microcystis aeruginosa FACHB-905 = DIANCHI905]
MRQKVRAKHSDRKSTVSPHIPHPQLSQIKKAIKVVHNN